jgi:hypothetical protein
MHRAICLYNSKVIFDTFLVVGKVDEIISKDNINKNLLNLFYS